jgi:serine/threonine-protein kinase
MAYTPPFPAPLGQALDRTVGRILGTRYRVLSRLGEGGMGTVYLCEHAVLGRRYAVKVLRPELAKDPELVERFRNEAIAASRIGGDHVVDVVDFGVETDGAIFYVMEALEGRSLGAILAEEGPFGVDRALGLLEQVCRALAAAHARRVVHRDVKPDNVFVVRRADGAECAKVIDFGISQVTPDDGHARLTRAGTIIGTPEYMAPEQAAGEPVDHRADVYALGVLAYEILTGTLPIVADTPVATLVAHQTRAPEPPGRRERSVPPEVDALVLRALAKRPEDRPQTMEAFAEDIARIRRRRSQGAEAAGRTRVVPGTAGEAAEGPVPREGSVPGTVGSAARTLVRPRDTIALPRAVARLRSPASRVLVSVVAVVVLAALAVWWRNRNAGGGARDATGSASFSSPSAAASASGASRSVSSASVPARITPETKREEVAPASVEPDASAVPAESRGAPRKDAARNTREPRRTDPHLQDPYRSGAPLKSDPFP